MYTPSIFNDMDNMFNEMFTMPFNMDKFFNDDFYSMSSNQLMNTDIEEIDNGYKLDIELPGFDKQDVKAELSDGYLTVMAEHKDNKEEKDDAGKYISHERYSGKCKRSFFVGENITQQDIKAAFENGVLKLFIPKKEDKKVEEKKYISIEG